MATKKDLFNQQLKNVKSGIEFNDERDDKNVSTIGDVKSLVGSGGTGGVTKDYVDEQDAKLQKQINDNHSEMEEQDLVILKNITDLRITKEDKSNKMTMGNYETLPLNDNTYPSTLLTKAYITHEIDTITTAMVNADQAIRDEIETAALQTFKYKGELALIADLPLTPLQGDLYKVLEDDSWYIWNGTEWVTKSTGDDIDLSNYYNKSEIDALLLLKADKAYVDAQNATQDANISLKATIDDLANEETARINADNNLSSRIGALEASAGTGGDIRFQQQFLIPSTYVRKRIGEGFNSIMLTNHPDILNGDDLIFTNSNKIFRKSPGSITWVDSAIVVPTGTQRVWNKEATLYALAVTFEASNKFAAIHRSTDQGATWTLWKQTGVNTSTSTGTTPLLAICRNATHYFIQAFRGGSSSLLYNIWRIQDIETGAVVQMQYQFVSTSGIDFFVATNEMVYWKEGSSIKRLKADNTTPVVTMTLPTPNFTIGTGGDVDDEDTLWIGNHNATNTKLFYANASTSYAFVGIDLAYPLTTGCVFFFKDDTYKYIVATSNTTGSGDYGVLKKTIDGGTWETLGKSTLSGFSGTSSGFEIRGVVGYNPITKRVRTDSPGTKTTNYSFGV